MNPSSPTSGCCSRGRSCWVRSTRLAARAPGHHAGRAAEPRDVRQQPRQSPMHESETRPTIACRLDALGPSERERRSELAELIRQNAASIEETTSGYRIRLSPDPGVCANALELIHLERRCCPFLDLALQFDAGDEAAVFLIGGGEGVKEFLGQNSVLGCAQLEPGSACCQTLHLLGRLHA